MSFRIWLGEKVYFDEYKKASFRHINNILKSQTENKTGYAPLILEILASLGGVTQLEVLANMFLMYAGHRATAADFIEGYKRLLSYSLANTGTVAQGPQKQLKQLPVKGMKFVYITPFGADVATYLFPDLSIEDTKTSVLSARKVKRNIILTRVLCRMVYCGMISHFEYGKAMVRVSESNGRIRKSVFNPHFTLNLKGSEIIVRCVRKRLQWEKKELENLSLLSRMTRGEETTILVITEDYLMSTDLFKRICENGKIALNLIFTDDITFLRSKGKNFFYTITYDGKDFIRKMI